MILTSAVKPGKVVSHQDWVADALVREGRLTINKKARARKSKVPRFSKSGRQRKVKINISRGA